MARIFARVVTPVLLGTALLWLGGCASPQQKEAKYLANGKKFLNEKDYTRAILEYRNAVKVMPKDAEAHYQLALAYLDSHNIQAGVAELKRITTQIDPKHQGAQLKLAELMATSQDKPTLEKSEQMAQSVLSAKPGDPEALDALAMAEFRLGKADDAAQHLEQALEHSPAHLRSAIGLAQIKMRQGDMAGAEAVLKTAAAQKPVSSDAVVALGEYYRLAKKPADAQKQFQEALQINPKNGPALLDLAHLQYAAGQKDVAGKTLARLSALPDARFKPLHAIYLFQTGQKDAAVAEFEKLAKEDPRDRTARSRLVAAYTATGKVAEAQKVLGEALQKNGKDVEALLQRAEISIRQRKYEDAQKDLTTTIQAQPDLAIAHYMMSKAQLGLGHTYNQRQELAQALRLNPNLLQVRIEMAQMLIGQKDAKGALDLLDRTPGQQKNALAVLVQRNWALLALGERDEAEKNVDMALAKVRAPDLLTQKAILDLESKKNAEGRTLLDEILKQNPEDFRALNLLGESYLMDKQPAAAIQKIQQYAMQRPQSSTMQVFLGEWMERAGKPGDARAAFVAARTLDPKDPAALMALARLDLTQNKNDEAKQLASQVISLDNRSSASMIIAGMADQQLGDRAGAIAQYQQALAIDPKSLPALNNLAFLLSQAGKPDDALKYAQQAVEIAPDAPAILDTIGWVYTQKGLYPMGIQYLEKAVAKDGTAVRRYHLAMAYLKAGQQQRGKEALQVALKMDPTLPEAKTAEALLQGGGK